MKNFGTVQASTLASKNFDPGRAWYSAETPTLKHLSPARVWYSAETPTSKHSSPARGWYLHQTRPTSPAAPPWSHLRAPEFYCCCQVTCATRAPSRCLSLYPRVATRQWRPASRRLMPGRGVVWIDCDTSQSLCRLSAYIYLTERFSPCYAVCTLARVPCLFSARTRSRQIV